MHRSFSLALNGSNYGQFNTDNLHKEGVLILEAVHRHSSDGAPIAVGRDLYVEIQHSNYSHTTESERVYNRLIPLFFETTHIGNNFPTPRIVITDNLMGMDRIMKLQLVELDRTTDYVIASNEEFVFTFTLTNK